MSGGTLGYGWFTGRSSGSVRRGVASDQKLVRSASVTHTWEPDKGRQRLLSRGCLMTSVNRVRDIDFWRGAVLIVILVDHIPGNPLEHFTPSPTSAVSGARASDFKRLTPRVGTTLGAPR